MKKIIKLIVAIVVGLIAICNLDVMEGYAASVSVSFGSSSYSKASGEEFPIGVYIKSDSVIGIHAIRLKYDNQKLQYLRGATKEAGGVILLKGTGGSTTIKYWLEFKAIGGGSGSIYSDVAKAYVNNNTELINVTSLPTASITIAGDDINAIEGTDDIAATEGIDITTSENDSDFTAASTAQPVDTEEGISESDESEDEYDTESEYNNIEITNDEDIDDKNDKNENSGNGKFILSVLLNLIIFVVLTLLGIKIISSVANKKKKRLAREFEDEFINRYDDATHHDFMGDEHMAPIPFNDYDTSMYNYNDDAVRYNPGDMNGQSVNLDVEFLSHDPIIEQMGYQQGNMHTNDEFSYIEQNLERSLEQQLRDQMNDMY